MHPALQGALIGLGIGVVLIVVEYLFVKKAAEERAVARHQKPVLDPTDKKRIQSILNFALFLPPAFAIGFWLIWG
ncbi:MAG TPA: hypothetical protein VNC62_12270 [Burkholderiales bacterium]|jgi:hypothetical protein|nr:hypothetical protein [Burkholderiales bacterium]